MWGADLGQFDMRKFCLVAGLDILVEPGVMHCIFRHAFDLNLLFVCEPIVLGRQLDQPLLGNLGHADLRAVICGDT